jgi:parallel beta-helix repeat protein
MYGQDSRLKVGKDGTAKYMKYAFPKKPDASIVYICRVTALLLFLGGLMNCRQAIATTFFVSPTGSNANSGTNISDPFLSINKALSMTAAGDTVEVRQGVYREQVSPQFGHTGNSNSFVTLRAYLNETVVVKASDIVTNWTLFDSTHHIWRTPWTFNSQQVFIHTNANPGLLDDGVLLKQIALPNSLPAAIYPTIGKTNYYFWVQTTNLSYAPLDIAQGPAALGWGESITNECWFQDPWNGTTNFVGYNYEILVNAATNYMVASHPNTFFYDRLSSYLYICLPDSRDPSTNAVEVSVRYAPMVNYPNPDPDTYMYVKNIKGRHGSSLTASLYGASGIGNGSIYDSCDFQWHDSAGLQLHTGGMATNCILANNGNLGGGGAPSSLFTHCTITNNNLRWFSKSWQCGGLKLGSSANVEYCEIAYNYDSSGLWYDTYREATPVFVRNNYVHHNGSAGIYAEVSQNIKIHNNLVVSNKTFGIAITGSDNCDAFNNTVVGTVNDGYTAAVQISQHSREL